MENSHWLEQVCPASQRSGIARWDTVRRDKQGFVTPEERWLKHDFKDLIRNSFRDSKLGELGMTTTKANFCVITRNFRMEAA